MHAASPLAIIILAAGKGTRMNSALPKVLHRIAGRPMLGHVLAVAEELSPARIVVVVGPDMPAVVDLARPHASVIQTERRGTGDAVRTALPALADMAGHTALVLCGDTPLIEAPPLAALLAARSTAGAAVAVLGMRVPTPNAYGRLILAPDGTLARIVEARDADAAEAATEFCNAGIMAIDGTLLPELLAGIGSGNAAGEYYLTDIVAAAGAQGLKSIAIEAPRATMEGVNSRAELAMAEAAMQRRLRDRALAEGVTMTDPASVYLASDTVLGRDVTLGPGVVFGPGVVVEDDVEIRAYCSIEGAVLRRGAVVGPFARLRPGTELGEAAHVGNFVELKAVHLGAGAKANHLTYLGDAEIGARSNIGAGTITCNYDGYLKHRTRIGADVFIGSDTAIVAPVTIGDGAMVAAGSVVTRDVAPDATAIARGLQVEKPGHALAFRQQRAAEKARREKD